MNPIFVLVALAVLAGQASEPAARAARAGKASAVSSEAHRLTGDEIRRSHARNLYEAIQLLRPGWLGIQPRGQALSLGPAVVYLFLRFATVVRSVLGESGTVLATRIAGAL